MGFEQLDPKEQKRLLGLKNFDQQKHPEIREGERWVTNIRDGSEDDNKGVYDADSNGGVEYYVGQEGIRIGDKAFMTDGSEYEGGRPVFISKKEYEKRKLKS